MAFADWSSLPSELIDRIAGCFLATNDVDNYMDLRAVCSSWRSATDDPRNSSDLRFRFRPRLWVIVDEVFQSDSRLLVNTATGRVLRKDLPLLRNYSAIATAHGGFFVLVDRKTTRAAGPVVYVADPHSENLSLCSRTDSFIIIQLAVQGGICADGEQESKAQLLNYVADIIDAMLVFVVEFSDEDLIKEFYKFPWTGHGNRCFLVKSAREVLIIFKLQHRMQVFKVGITDRDHTVEPVKSIGNNAIFVGYCGCLSIRADKFPSINADCINYVKFSDSSMDKLDIYMYDLNSKKEERVSRAIDSLNPTTLSSADPPFTIIQFLSSYTINVRESKFAVEEMLQGRIILDLTFTLMIMNFMVEPLNLLCFV